MTSPSQSASDLSAFAGAWVLATDGTSIEFHTKELWVFPAKGTFRASGGTGTVASDGGISGTLVIDAASVDTKNKRRDTHLRTADFFDVESFSHRHLRGHGRPTDRTRHPRIGRHAHGPR